MDSYMKDPNMAEAQAKIAAVLKEHNLMGAVLICGKERAGFFHEMSPDWSCIKIEGEEVRVRAHRQDFPSAEAQQECIRLSVQGVMGMLSNMQNIAHNLRSLVVLFSRHFDIRQIITDVNIQEKKGQ